MLKTNFEYRKGIFFIRLIGEMNKENCKSKELEIKQILTWSNFEYVVINTNFLNKIDLDGLNSIAEICSITVKQSNLVICDRFNILKKLRESLDKLPYREREILLNNTNAMNEYRMKQRNRIKLEYTEKIFEEANKFLDDINDKLFS